MKDKERERVWGGKEGGRERENWYYNTLSIHLEKRISYQSAYEVFYQ